MKRYTPFEPAKIDGFNTKGPSARVGSAAVAQKSKDNIEILSTVPSSNLNSTGPQTFNYSSTGLPKTSGHLPTIKEKALLGSKSRRGGLPLEIPAIDHQKAKKKLQSIIDKCDDKVSTGGISKKDHTELIKSLPSFKKRGVSQDNNADREKLNTKKRIISSQSRALISKQ